MKTIITPPLLTLNMGDTASMGSVVKVPRNLFDFGMNLFDENFWEVIDEMSDVYYTPAQYYRFYGDDEESMIEEAAVYVCWMPWQLEHYDPNIALVWGSFL